MLGKKMASFKKKLAQKMKSNMACGSELEEDKKKSLNQLLLIRQNDCHVVSSSSDRTPKGFFAVYVGENRERFVVPTGFLSHPLFKILLETSYDDELEFDQKNRLVVPCSVSTFQEVLNSVESCNGRFDFGDVVDEFVSDFR